MSDEEPLWVTQIKELLAVTLDHGMSQTAAAQLDDALHQTDFSRWKLGKYEKEPSAEKMAGVKRATARARAQLPTDFDRGAIYVAEAVRDLLDDLLATSASEGGLKHLRTLRHGARLGGARSDPPKDRGRRNQEGGSG